MKQAILIASFTTLLVAVYLGSLSFLSLPPTKSLPSSLGALTAYIAIFLPGLVLHTAFLSLWRLLRRYRPFVSFLRGVNAAAVGLIYTAVYRLWEIGNVDSQHQGGSSLGRDPWWVVITTTSFVGGMWFGWSAPVAIVAGGGMGMVWYGVVSA
jgi:chromate transport protein ChrA